MNFTNAKSRLNLIAVVREVARSVTGTATRGGDRTYFEQGGDAVGHPGIKTEVWRAPSAPQPCQAERRNHAPEAEQPSTPRPPGFRKLFPPYV